MSDNHRPLILVTNDDGVQAGGIRALTEMVKPLGDVVVVAPDQPNSGMSHAITVKNPLYITLIHEEPHLKIYKCNGTPADCVKLAINKILHRQPDLCVSGINHGSNSSVSVHYSGTVGAAREGAINGIPSIAFSLLSYEADADFSHCTPLFQNVVKHVLANGLHGCDLLNVNAPEGDHLKGLKVCRQANGRWIEEFLENEDPRKRKYYWLTGYFQNDEPDATDTDEYYLKHGYVTVVPCLTDQTLHTAINQLTTLNHDLQMQ